MRALTWTKQRDKDKEGWSSHSDRLSKFRAVGCSGLRPFCCRVILYLEHNHIPCTSLVAQWERLLSGDVADLFHRNTYYLSFHLALLVSYVHDQDSTVTSLCIHLLALCEKQSKPRFSGITSGNQVPLYLFIFTFNLFIFTLCYDYQNETIPIFSFFLLAEALLIGLRCQLVEAGRWTSSIISTIFQEDTGLVLVPSVLVVRCPTRCWIEDLHNFTQERCVTISLTNWKNWVLGVVTKLRKKSNSSAVMPTEKNWRKKMSLFVPLSPLSSTLLPPVQNCFFMYQKKFLSVRKNRPSDIFYESYDL